MLNATPILRAYAKYRKLILDRQDPAQEQEIQLIKLVRRGAATRFGKDHGFKSIDSVESFQRQVPLRNYDAFWSDYWKPAFPKLEHCTWPGRIPFFAVSSGTSSGTTKYIPYTAEMTASNTKAAMDLLVHHALNRPRSRIFAGRCFFLGGSTDLVEQAGGVFSGDLSGIAVKTMRFWAKPWYFPPPRLALLKNWEEKIAVLAERSLSSNIRMLSGVPTWLLIFIDKLVQLVPDSFGRLSRIYPELEMLVHGGVNFSPYRKRFEEILQGSRAELREVYPASEGFLAMADRGYGDGLRLVLDHGIFFEFVPLDELEKTNPTRHWLKTIECGVNYAVVMSTCAGLWSYVLGDTVRFVDKETPRLLVTGRTSYYLSAFGEHLIAEEIEDGVASGAKAISAEVSDYSVGPVYPEKTGGLGGHHFIIEFCGRIPSSEEMVEFARVLDQKLCERNEDYEAHRARGYGLKAPQVWAARPGMFAAWMKSLGKLGGQNKVPRIITNQNLFENLVQFAAAYSDKPNTGAPH